MALINGWYECPYCGKKLQKIPEHSVLYGTPVYCRHCKVEWYPTVWFGKELDDDEPFPVKSEE